MKRFGMVTMVLLVAVFLSFAAHTANAGDGDPVTPTVLKGGTIITTDQAKALLDKKGAMFCDMRKAVNFGKGHLSGAISLPYKGDSENVENFDASNDQIDISKLPADKNGKVVFYSDGPNGWKSYKAAVLAIKAGYKNVMWYREGTAGWEAKKYSMLQ